MTALDDTVFRFGVDSDGNYGYIIKDEVGADSVIPFNKISSFGIYIPSGNYEYTIEIPKGINKIYWLKIIQASATCDNGVPTISGTAYVDSAETLYHFYQATPNISSSHYIWIDYCCADVTDGVLKIENNKNCYNGDPSASYYTYLPWFIVGIK